MQNLKPIILRADELILFCFGLAMIVPPIPSEAVQVYPLAPVLIIGGGAFATSLFLGRHRGAEHFASIVIKLLFYVGLAWVVHLRVFS